MTFTQGETAIVTRMQAESIEFYGMAGRGATAPGCIVIRKLGHNSLHPYVVHFGNTQDGGYYFGDYCKSLDDAYTAFRDKKRRYDPDASMHLAFLEPA